jgi:outer membrane immunogenic protein
VDQTATATSAGGLNVTHNAPQTLNNGFLGGVQVGYNYQVAQWVLGAEAQFSWTNLDTNNPCAVGGIQNPVASTLLATCHAKIDSFGTAAGRLGWATDRILIYVKGGAAWARDHFDYSSQTFTAFLTPLDSISDTRWGWMAGVGGEYALDGNWSAKIEYDFLDLGTKTYNLPVVTSLLPTAVHTQDIRERIQLIKVGLNYKFGYAAAPVGVYK